MCYTISIFILLLQHKCDGAHKSLILPIKVFHTVACCVTSGIVTITASKLLTNLMSYYRSRHSSMKQYVFHFLLEHKQKIKFQKNVFYEKDGIFQVLPKITRVCENHACLRDRWKLAGQIRVVQIKHSCRMLRASYKQHIDSDRLVSKGGN